MQNAQEAITAMQEQALDALKSGQSTTCLLYTSRCV